MYSDYFGLKETPFSIAPDPRFLYMSHRHREALAHLLYGTSAQGGFVLLTGEVGTGKTTICRCFLDQIPDNTRVAFVVNPKLSALELLENICDEFGIEYPAGATIKLLVAELNQFLLDTYAAGNNAVLIIDEAQNLSVDVLEQLRLLTNLETAEKKLLQIVLLGQPELKAMLAQPELRQLSQRVTARYHLGSLDRDEIEAYVRYRLSVAGIRKKLFAEPALKAIYQISGGTPRIVNLLCDRALLGAYAQHKDVVDKATVKQAAREVLGEREKRRLNGFVPAWAYLATLALATVVVGAVYWGGSGGHPAAVPEAALANAQPVLREAPSAEPEPAEPVPVSDALDIKALWPMFLSENESERLAYRAVFASWGYDYRADSSAVCDYAAEVGLECLRREGNWRSLVSLNRPAVLKLISPEGRQQYVALLEVKGQQIRIAVGDEQLLVQRHLIDDFWFGEYALLWNVPPYRSLPQQQAAADEAQWLSDKLSQIRASRQADSGGALDSGLAFRAGESNLQDDIRWFQALMGIEPDGIAGALTLIHLNNALNADVPMLAPLNHTAAAASREARG